MQDAAKFLIVFFGIFLTTIVSGQEDSTFNNPILVVDSPYHDNHGFHYGFAMAIGLDDFSVDTTKHLTAVHLDTYLGWRFNRKLSLTSGLGFEFNESRIASFRFDTQFLSLYVSGRYNLLNTRYMPYVYGRVGYGFGPPQEEAIVDHENGQNYQAGLGLTFPSRQNYRYFLAFVWHHQVAKGAESFIDPLGNEINTKYDILINRLLIKFGMEFN